MNFLMIVCALLLLVTSPIIAIHAFMENNYWDAGVCVALFIYAFLFLFEDWRNDFKQ